MRKDVECVFGILKKRFRILRLPFLYGDPNKIVNVFRACCIMHNWLLEFDGSADIGQQECDWINQESRNPGRAVGAHKPFVGGSIYSDEPTENESEFDILRESMVRHFACLREKKGLKWVRHVNDALQTRFLQDTSE